MRPNIGTIEIHENGHIPNKANIPLSAVSAQSFPLLVKGELDGLRHLEFLQALLLQFGESFRIPVSELFRPRQPSPGTKSLVQDTVAGVVRQPEGVLFPEALEPGPLLIVVMGEEITRSLQQQRPFALFHFVK